MATLTPYLNFNGNCEQAFTFYKTVFGGEFDSISRFKEVPQSQFSDSESEKIMHISLPLGPNSVLMGSDVPESYGKISFGENVHLSIDTESEEEATKLFNNLSEGGQVTMPLEKTFWGAFFGMFTDKFGIKWMISHTYQS